MSQKQQTSLHRVHNAAAITIPLFLLVACGGDVVTEVTEVHETGMKLVEKGDELPKCTTENEGAMIYALDSAAAYACINREWVSFNGKDGADGKDGRDGKDGEDGAKGDKGDQGEKGDKGDKGDAGEKGAQGDQGKQGEKGDSGDKGDSGIGCSLTDNGDGTVSVACGDSTTTINKAICGTTPYDPAKQFCDTRDGKAYKYVTIGTQTWMAENLNYAYLLPTETLDSSSWCYDNDSVNCTKYGRLYTWSAAMDSAAVFSANAKGCGNGLECSIKTPARGFCPAGWHVPDTTEWWTLYSAVGKSAYALQAKGFEEWPDATDEFGFSALPAGFFSKGDFFTVRRDVFPAVCFWSAIESSARRAHNWGLSLDVMGLDMCDFKDDGFTVRCVKD